MYKAEFFIAGGVVVFKFDLGIQPSPELADLEAQHLLEGLRLRTDRIIGYRVVDNSGTEVASSRLPI